MKRLLLRILLIGGLLILAGPHHPVSAQTSETIRIGAFLPLTGEFSTYGNEHERGLRLAVDFLNQQGGVQGKKLEFVMIDNQGTQSGTLAALRKIEQSVNFPLIFGGIISDLAMTAASFVQRTGKILFVQTATNPAIAKLGPNIFRFIFPDDAQGRMMARFALQELGVQRVVVFKNTSRLYSSGLAEEFSRAYAAIGGTIVRTIPYDDSTADFTSLVEPLKEETNFAVYIPGYDLDTARVIHAFRKTGLHPTFLGGDAWESINLTNLIPDLDNAFYTTAYARDIPSEANRDFVKRYRAKYHTDPTFNAAMGYGAVLLLAELLEKTDPPWTVEKLRKTLQTTTFNDFTGQPLRFDKYGNALRPVVIMKFNKGKRTFFKMIHP